MIMHETGTAGWVDSAISYGDGPTNYYTAPTMPESTRISGADTGGAISDRAVPPVTAALYAAARYFRSKKESIYMIGSKVLNMKP